MLQGPDKGRIYETPNEPAVIGRTSDHIQLSDHSASRRHAELRPANGSWVLADLDSSNGTYLNGQRVINPTPVKHGDQIRVGSTLLVFSGKDHGETREGAALARGLIDRDLVDIDMSNPSGGSSILSAIDASEESVILQPPETADAVAAWNVVYKVAETLGQADSVDVFLNRVADIMFEHVIADRLVLLMSEDGVLSPRLARTHVRDRASRGKIVTSSTIVNHVLSTRSGVLCANAMTDDRFAGDDPQDSIHRLGLRSIICVPVVSRDIIHGVFHLDCSMSHHTYTQEQLRLCVAIGRLTGMAIDNFALLESRVQTERLAAAGEAVAFLSHHIRNILQGLQGGADVIELGLKKQNMDALQSGWKLIRRNLDRILVLTMNMLTFSKSRQPRIESMQLNRIIDDVVTLAHNRADEKGAVILTELEDLPAIPIDPEGMHQVALNIVLNALDAVPESTGRVNLATRYDAELVRVVLTISDNGPGIPEEDRQRIFEAFQSSKGHGGTGLGLAAAKKIVTELGGTITLLHSSPEGTSFEVSLPASHVRLADSDKTHGPG